MREGPSGRTRPRVPRDAPSPTTPPPSPGLAAAAASDRDALSPGLAFQALPFPRTSARPARAPRFPFRAARARPRSRVPGRIPATTPAPASSPAAPPCRRRACAPASSVRLVPPDEDCPPNRPSLAHSSPPRSRPASSRTRRSHPARRPRSRSARRHGSSLRDSPAPSAPARARSCRPCRSASGGGTAIHWPWCATCRTGAFPRPRPEPCWRPPHACAAGDRDCATCRGGKSRPPSSGPRQGPGVPSPGPSFWSGSSSLPARPACALRPCRGLRRQPRRRPAERPGRRISAPRRSGPVPDGGPRNRPSPAARGAVRIRPARCLPGRP